MHPHLRLSSATSITWPYSYTYDLYQVPRPSSRPSWSFRCAVIKNLLTSELTTFYCTNFWHGKDYTGIIHQLQFCAHLSCMIHSIKTWHLNLPTCSCNLFCPLSIILITYTNICGIDVFIGPATLSSRGFLNFSPYLVRFILKSFKICYLK